MQIRDGRALMGAVAFFSTGFILSSMFSLFIEAGTTGDGVIRSRWWWEIVLNMQILAAVLVWLCYSDRIRTSEGLKRSVMQFRLMVGILIVLVPTWIGLVSVSFNWFIVRPPDYVLDWIVSGGAGLWLFALLMPRFFRWGRLPKGRKKPPIGSLIQPSTIWWVLPFFAALALWLHQANTGGKLHYVYAPPLLYLQAALPFFRRGFFKRENDPLM